jgi:hypothetical protein
MAWTTIQSSPDQLDEEIASFASGVTSIDGYSIASQSRNEVVALVEYTA